MPSQPIRVNRTARNILQKAVDAGLFANVNDAASTLIVLADLYGLLRGNSSVPTQPIQHPPTSAPTPAKASVLDQAIAANPFE